MIKKTVLFILTVMMMLSVYVKAEDADVTIEDVVGATAERANLALEKPVILNSGEQKENPAQNLTDGNLTAYWGVQNSGNYVVIDLEDVYYIDSIEFKPEASRAYGYKIEGSCDGSAFTEIITKENNASAEMLSCEFAPAQARYVRFTVTQLPKGVEWVNIKEIFIYGEESGSDLQYEEEPLTIEVNDGVVTGTIKTGVTVLNGKAITLIVAVYDGNRMIAYKAETHILPYSLEAERSIEMTSDDMGVDINGKTVEFFVWDNLNSMQTLVPPIILEV